MYEEQNYFSKLGEGDILSLVCCMNNCLWYCDPGSHGPLSILDQILSSSRPLNGNISTIVPSMPIKVAQIN